MIISLDTETTGVDLAHGAMPFLVTSWDGENPINFWEWDVDPLTRRPEIPDEDLVAIAELVDGAELVYLQGSKFDWRALASIGVDLPWAKVRDTLVASHLLATNHGHRLDQLTIEYLGVDIEKYELHVKEVVQACRAIVKRDYPHWNIADEGKPGMPSVKAGTDRDEDKPWKNDMWLPRALAKEMAKSYHNPKLAVGVATPKEWLTACSRYANADSEHTLPLGLELERQVRERGLWAIYEHRLRLPQVYGEMEAYGVTAIGEYIERTAQDYGEHVAESEDAMVSIAAEYGHDLQLAKGAALNDSMRDFFYGRVERTCPRCGLVERVKHWKGQYGGGYAECQKCGKGNTRRAAVKVPLATTKRSNLALPVIRGKKTGNASLDADAMREYVQTLDDGPALDFIELLADKRMYDVALTYMRAYQRYGIPVPGHPGYFRIHASINPCGTDHLRAACNSPNMQNVAGESKELSNRACFGPLPDREWYNMDFRQIENRIPAYESGEPKLVEVFDRPDEGPYWGSLYYLTASVLYPAEFNECCDEPDLFKKRYPRLYKRAKFFNLARLYGAGKRKGDLLSGISGSCDMVDSALPLLAKLQAKYLRDAERLGYVETLPDRTVDPTRGYPILASRTEDGRVLSTTPFNYHTSGTACWVKNVALVRCSDQCAEWRREGFDARVSLEVHDSILFDFPRGRDMQENLPRALVLRGLMERCGPDLVPAIPTPVSCEYHVRNWAEGVAV